MSRNVVGGYQVLGTFSLNVEKSIWSDSVKYELFAHWNGPARVQVRTGESLIINADGREMRFRVVESDLYQDVACERGCIFDDRAYYPATAGEIRAIAGAKRVTVELIGERRTIEGEFNELNFERYQEFVAQHVPPQPP